MKILQGHLGRGTLERIDERRHLGELSVLSETSDFRRLILKGERPNSSGLPIFSAPLGIINLLASYASEGSRSIAQNWCIDTGDGRPLTRHVEDCISVFGVLI
jgi:hypothetical protein